MSSSEQQSSRKESKGKVGCFLATGCVVVLLGMVAVVMLIGYLIFGDFIDNMLFSYSPYLPDFYYYISFKRIEFMRSLESLF